MKKIAIACAVTMLAGPTLAQETATARTSFIGKTGQENGTAMLTPVPGGVLIQMEVNGLPPKSWVAVHFHETGACDHTTGHDSAGGHFNPTGAGHGFLAEGGPHGGDMPNQHVGDDGVLRAEILNAAVTLDAGEKSVRGRALMVHGGKDDYKTQPSGDAGDRQACGVIE